MTVQTPSTGGRGWTAGAGGGAVGSGGRAGGGGAATTGGTGVGDEAGGLAELEACEDTTPLVAEEMEVSAEDSLVSSLSTETAPGDGAATVAAGEASRLAMRSLTEGGGGALPRKIRSHSNNAAKPPAKTRPPAVRRSLRRRLQLRQAEKSRSFTQLRIQPRLFPITLLLALGG